MNTTKLREALAEMESERSVLEEGIGSLRKLIALLEGTAPEIQTETISPGESRRSYIDDAVDLFRSCQKPLHVKEIAGKISEARGISVQRASLESTLIRHINKANQPRIAKFGPSMFGLPEWKQSQPTLAQIA